MQNTSNVQVNTCTSKSMSMIGQLSPQDGKGLVEIGINSISKDPRRKKRSQVTFLYLKQLRYFSPLKTFSNTATYVVGTNRWIVSNSDSDRYQQHGLYIRTRIKNIYIYVCVQKET